MLNQTNKANYHKALQRIQQLVRPTLLKDAPQPHYKPKQIQSDKPIPPISNKPHTQPPNYPTNNYPPTNNRQNSISSKPSFQNHYQYSAPIDQREQRKEWHISMLHNKQKSRKKQIKKKSVKFKSAATTLSSFRNTDVKEWQNNKEISDAVLYKALKSKFNISQFRNNQKAIIKCAMLGNDVFVCMPTGGGKSLTFQLPLILETGVTFCILPLKALIYDQEMQAQSMHLRAYGLTGNTEHEAASLIYRAMKDCQNSKQGIIIFSTPQKLNRSQKLIDILTQISQRGMFKRIVIDEVHCVSTWGRDFRKEYQNLGFLKRVFPNVPILALTATASSQIKEDIVDQLGIKGCYYFESSFNRPNLVYEVRPKQPSKIIDQIVDIINRYHEKCGIIYCTTRKQTEQVTGKLQKKGISAHHFHAQMSESLKKDVQRSWVDNKIHVVVATIAFGMGINKPDVRFVIHYSFSKSLQNYYQESGRAGRDGQRAECILFYRYTDKNNQVFMISNNEISSQENKNYLISKLNEMISFCQDKTTCRRQMQLNYFGEEFDPRNCNRCCDNCIKNSRGDTSNQVDCYAEAYAIVEFVLHLNQKREFFTQTQLTEFLKGNHKKLEQKMKFFQKKNINCQVINMFTGQIWRVAEIKRFIECLTSKEYLKEEVKSYGGHSIMYISTSDIRLQKLESEGQFWFQFIQKNKKQRPPKLRAGNRSTEESNDNSSDEIREIQFDQYVYKEDRQSDGGEQDFAMGEYMRYLQDEKNKEKQAELDKKMYDEILMFMDEEDQTTQ